MGIVFMGGDNSGNLPSGFSTFFSNALTKESIFEFRDFKVEKLNCTVNDINFDFRLISNGLRVYVYVLFFPNFHKKIVLKDSEIKRVISIFQKFKRIQKSGMCITLLLVVDLSERIEFESPEVRNVLRELFEDGVEIIGYRMISLKGSISSLKRLPVEF